MLDVDRRNAPQVIDRAELMDTGLLTYAATFTSPNPPEPKFASQIALTGAAQVAARKGGVGMAAARYVQVGILLEMMESELLYMESVANAGNPELATQVLLQGGVEIAGVGKHQKDILTIRQPQPGAPVTLEANVSALLGAYLHRKHFISWEYTLDGKTFVALPSTPEGLTTVTGLAALTVVGFRVAVTVARMPMLPWSQVVNFLVH
jgi:hypothetical protein